MAHSCTHRFLFEKCLLTAAKDFDSDNKYRFAQYRFEVLMLTEVSNWSIRKIRLKERLIVQESEMKAQACTVVELVPLF